MHWNITSENKLKSGNYDDKNVYLYRQRNKHPYRLIALINHENSIQFRLDVFSNNKNAYYQELNPTFFYMEYPYWIVIENPNSNINTIDYNKLMENLLKGYEYENGVLCPICYLKTEDMKICTKHTEHCRLKPISELVLQFRGKSDVQR